MADEQDNNSIEQEDQDNDAIQSGLQNVAEAADELAAVTGSGGARGGNIDSQNLDLILDVNLHVTVEVGRVRMTIQDLLQLGQGSVMELQKLAGESLDIYVNGKPMAKGEAVIVNEKFGVRLTEVLSQEDIIESLG